MKMEKTVCFIGHRVISDTPELRAALRDLVRDLIERQNVTSFIFGSRSAFDRLAYGIVTELRAEYPAVRRVVCPCRSEAVLLSSDQHSAARSEAARHGFSMQEYEAELPFAAKETAGRASYVERNRAMIDASDCCIFYYEENYLPERRKRSPRALSDFQPKSGTRLAWDYAMQKKKEMVNLCETE